ncbi:MAG: ABC transporter permease [Bacteroides sp.]|nr:ABC transporter permease [Bacteroides sp.]
MNRLVWKLLRQHISIGQLTGFFFANLFGMVIILLSIQFYQDVIPLFTAGESFMKKDYLIVSKQVDAFSSFHKKGNTFTAEEIKDLSEQPFTQAIGQFTPSRFDVSAGVGMQRGGMQFSTEMFFESVPDAFIDVNLNQWHFDEDTRSLPIIIPRNYLNLYNFGFAQSRNLPQLSEGVISMIGMDIRIRGNGQAESFKGNIVGFSNRLNTILVPDEFMQWANNKFAPNAEVTPSRLIVEVNNPADAGLARYFREKGYEIEDDKLDAGKMTYFLRLVAGIVLAIGLVISALSFYILMLSIYLLLQKNTVKLESLLLIGYSPAQVALPYQTLTVALNFTVLLLSVLILVSIRTLYIEVLSQLYPNLGNQSLATVICIGILLFAGVSLINLISIRRKIMRIWRNKD